MEQDRYTVELQFTDEIADTPQEGSEAISSSPDFLGETVEQPVQQPISQLPVIRELDGTFYKKVGDEWFVTSPENNRVLDGLLYSKVGDDWYLVGESSETSRKASEGNLDALTTETNLIPPPPERLSFSRQLAYGFMSTPSDVQNLSAVLESRFPLGSFVLEDDPNIRGIRRLRWASPDEMYGEGFSEASVDERRQMIVNRRNRDLEEAFPELVSEDQLGASTLAGSAVGIIASPTTLAPLGQTYKAIAGLGALWGGSYVALDEYINKGDFELGSVAGGAALGAGGAVAGVAVGRSVGNQFKKWRAARKSEKQVKAANDGIDLVNDALVQAVIDDVPIKDMPAYMQRVTGFTPEKITEMVAISGRKPFIPSKQHAEMAARIPPEGINALTRSATREFFDNFLGVLSTRVSAISPEIGGRLRRYDAQVHTNTANKLEKVKPFLRNIDSLTGEARENMALALYNGDFAAVRAMLQNLFGKEAVINFDQVNKTLIEIYDMLVDAGYTNLNKLDFYFPRSVKDLDGLLGSLDKQRFSIIDSALKKRAEQLNTSVGDLPPTERDRIVNNVLSGYVPKISTSGIGFTKGRTIQNLDKDRLKFYDDPVDSLIKYIASTVENAERRKFFGKAAINMGEDALNLDVSIGRIVDNLSPRLSRSQAEDLQDLLKARFINANQRSGPLVQAMRNFGYMSTIADIEGALTQVADLGVAAYSQGLGNTIKALLTKNKISVKDFNLDQVVAQEFKTGFTTSTALNTLFKYSAFSHIDRLGKNVILNSALTKGQKWSRSPAGIAKLEKKYKAPFGDEYFNKLVDDLNAGRMTEEVKLYLFSELADVQPITLSEVPVGYLNNPNGRLFYTLKTWTIKQLDVMRRDILQQYADGQTYDATRNMIAYSLIVPTANMTVAQVKDIIMQRPLPPVEDFPDEWLENFFRTLGVNQYIADTHFKGGRIARGASEMLLPPLSWVDAVGVDLINLFQGDLEIDNMAIYRELPLVGKMWYNFFGGGLERAYERRDREIYKGYDIDDDI